MWLKFKNSCIKVNVYIIGRNYFVNRKKFYF